MDSTILLLKEPTTVKSLNHSSGKVAHTLDIIAGPISNKSLHKQVLQLWSS